MSRGPTGRECTRLSSRSSGPRCGAGSIPCVTQARPLPGCEAVRSTRTSWCARKTWQALGHPATSSTEWSRKVGCVCVCCQALPLSPDTAAPDPVVPPPPRNLHIPPSSITESSFVMTWGAPESDGGDPIREYEVTYTMWTALEGVCRVRQWACSCSDYGHVERALVALQVGIAAPSPRIDTCSERTTLC